MTALLANIAYLFSRLQTVEHQRQPKYHLPLPSVCHMVLEDNVINNRSIFLIGDVHGCKDELVELLRLARLEEEGKDILPIFVGDLLNKGPKSLETMEFLRSLDHLAVRGNHEEAVLYQVLKWRADNDYNLPEKYKWITGLTDSDIEYHTNLPYTISIPSLNAIIVHAGLIPGVPLQNQHFKDMVCMRNLLKTDNDKAYVARELRTEGEAWASLWPGPQHVYFGHDAVRKFQNYTFATGLDTGCLYGFSLTGLFLNGCKKKIEVKAKMVYRPP